MSKLIPLLSDGMIDALKSILETTESTIASELLEAHNAITACNQDFFWMSNEVNKDMLKSTLIRRIDELITDEVRALSIRKDVFEISFTPKGKELKYSDSGTWSRENRQTGKPGRIIKKLMKFDYKERDIEVFNNLLKAHMINNGNFKLVEGSDITKYYHEDMYYKVSGTLGNSCMRYDECQSYFKVYEDNAKMLVCLKNDLVLGRAIVWEIGGKTYMDRVYVCDDYLEEQFFAYAKENNWYIRECNSLLHSGDSQVWIAPDGSKIYSNISIKLKDKYSLMPYVDSFRYYDPNDNTINTCWSKGCISLDSTDGTYEGYPYNCDCCGETFMSYEEGEMPDELVWSDYEDMYLCENCREWCEGLGEYIRDTTSTVDVVTNNGVEEYPWDYVNESKIIRSEPHYVGRSGWFVQINDEWYRTDYRSLTIEDGIIDIRN